MGDEFEKVHHPQLKMTQYAKFFKVHICTLGTSGAV